jgi:hypothetical protein
LPSGLCHPVFRAAQEHGERPVITNGDVVGAGVKGHALRVVGSISMTPPSIRALHPSRVLGIVVLEKPVPPYCLSLAPPVKADIKNHVA